MGALYKKYRKMADGGINFSGLGAINAGITSSAVGSMFGPAGQVVQQLGAGITDAIDAPDKYGVQSDAGSLIKGSFQGGPVGALLGYMANKQAKNQRTRIQYQQNFNRVQNENNYSAAAVANEPSLVAGNKNASMFAVGGMMPIGDPTGPEIKPTVHDSMDNSVQMHDDLTYILANGALPKNRPIGKSSDRTLLNKAYIFAQQNGSLAPAERIKRYFDQPVGNNPEDQLRAKLNAIGGYSPVQMWKESPDMSLVKQAGRPQFEQPVAIHANGGTIHIKEGHEGRFTAYKKRTGKTTEEALHSSNAHVRKMANFANNASKWHHKADGGEIQTPLADQYMTGGQATPLSSNNTEMEGNTHAEGGINIPAAGAQLEDGETTMGNFVFSDKLGFAKLHKPIAKAIGIIEQKPQTKDRITALNLLHGKEQKLAASQELFKKMHGIK